MTVSKFSVISCIAGIEKKAKNTILGSIAVLLTLVAKIIKLSGLSAHVGYSRLNVLFLVFSFNKMSENVLFKPFRMTSNSWLP